MAKSIAQRQNESEITMAEIKKDISFIKEEITEIKDVVKDFIAEAPCKFANKETEIKVRELEKSVDGIINKMAFVSGGAIVVFFLIQLLLKHYGV